MHGRLQQELIAFDGHQVVAAVLQHELARGLGLGVQGVQAYEPPLKLEPRAQGAHRGYHVRQPAP